MYRQYLSFLLVISVSLTQVTKGEIHRTKTTGYKSAKRAGSAADSGDVALTEEMPSQESGMDAAMPWLLHEANFQTYDVWLYSIVGAIVVGLSGILPLLIIPLEAGPSLRHGAPAARLKLMLSFAVGSLLGDVFCHLLPEVWNYMDRDDHGAHTRIGLWVIAGLLFFLIIEKLLGDETEFQPLEDTCDEVYDCEPNTKPSKPYLHSSQANRTCHQQNTASRTHDDQNTKANRTQDKKNTKASRTHGDQNTNANRTSNSKNSKASKTHGNENTNASRAGGKKNSKASRSVSKESSQSSKSGTQLSEEEHKTRTDHDCPTSKRRGHQHTDCGGVQAGSAGSRSPCRTGAGPEDRGHLAASCDRNQHPEARRRKRTVSSTSTSSTVSHAQQEEQPRIKVSGYLNLFANVVDNFTHGLAVAGSFLVSRRVGLVTTGAILVHEIPHEVGDFAILLRSGFDRWKAAKAQLLTATGGVFGAITALTAEQAGERTAWILGFTSGGFLYIALVTVVPDLLQEKHGRESVKQVCCLILGVLCMVFVTYISG